MFYRAQSPKFTTCCGNLAPSVHASQPGPVASSGDGIRSLPSSPPPEMKPESKVEADCGAPVRPYAAPLQSKRSIEIFAGRFENDDSALSKLDYYSRGNFHEESGILEQAFRSASHPKQEEPEEDATSVLQHTWSASSSGDSLDQDTFVDRERSGFPQQSVLDSEDHPSFGGLTARPRNYPLSSFGLTGERNDYVNFFHSIGLNKERGETANYGVGKEKEGARLKRVSPSRDWSVSWRTPENVEEEENENASVQPTSLIDALRREYHYLGTDTSSGHSALSSSSSSSIGKVSEDSFGSVTSDVDSEGDMEVESGNPRPHRMSLSALESALPVRRGLSRYWNGKAKSFASLQDVSSLADLAKPENTLNRRRRLTPSHGSRASSPLTRPNSSGIAKKPPSGTGKSSLAVAVAMGSKFEDGPSKSLSLKYVSEGVQRSVSWTDLRHHEGR